MIAFYCIGFIMDYLVTIKYTIDDGFSDSEIIFSKEERRIEIELLIKYSKVIIIYVFSALILIIYNIIKLKGSRKI